jgi:hypothetical protein
MGMAGVPTDKTTLGASGILAYTEIRTCASTEVAKPIIPNRAMKKIVRNLAFMTLIIKLFNKLFAALTCRLK